MAEELQELRELVLQLQAENDRLRQEPVSVAPGPSASVNPSHFTVPSRGTPVVERLVLVPRDRKCPIFRGRTGIGLMEWLEEVEASMRARHLSMADQAFFLFDHLEGEAKEEIKYRPQDRTDPVKIIAVLKELYGCTESYVSLQQAFFARRQEDGESLQEFSLALMGLMEAVKQRAPADMENADLLLRDQFIEHVLDGALRRELKQLVRRQPMATLLDVRGEAIRWEREGLSRAAHGRSSSVPAVLGVQYGVHGGPQGAGNSSHLTAMEEVRALLTCQQKQLSQLTQSVARLQNSSQRDRAPQKDPVICRRCQQPGHFARECDGLRIRSGNLPRQRISSQPNSQPHPVQPSEN
ncbi:uncharacterized protein LOC125748791 [Brienomyrus brachyistius]|uniref:uncharacterized protein LOC125748791 n=1 Tax=Brienomyrus brachyistius TaxID=42636 RepID=UPI0020B349E3|nr:uncharacterized protein LOC125748791 [Brienomyrus brachyistius]